MKKFLIELRRREVFRSAGLYVGVAWIVIEVSSVLLPVFGAPDAALRWLVIVAMVGFPIAMVLAWVFDVTEQGVVVQPDASETGAPPIGGRKMDFVVIGLLSVALVISVYLNFTRAPADFAEPEPLTVLIADFRNETGNPLFDGSLEQALTIGMEGASFINTLRRDQALESARAFDIGIALDEATARLVSVRENADIVLAGTISGDEGDLELSVRALDPASGEVRADAATRAEGNADVLIAMNRLAAEVRDELGDRAEDVAALRQGESLTTNSLEAMKAYAAAQDLARDGRDEEAIDRYREAVELDDGFARAWSGWALSAFKVGRGGEATELWSKALSLQERMTNRERYRTFGLYYTVVSLNYDKAIENYRQLVEEYPADGAGNNNLAILYVYTGQYDKALAQSAQLLRIYPKRTLYRANHAQYALYAGEPATATEYAQSVIDEDPEFFKSYMILALVALYEGDNAAAVSHYEAMAASGERGSSLATTGLADIALYEKRPGDATGLLVRGLEADRKSADERGVATKTVALAQAMLAQENSAEALSLLDGLPDSRQDGQLIPTAEIRAAQKQFAETAEIADRYREQLRPTAAAYAALVDGLIDYNRGDYAAAIRRFREGIEAADLWLLRFHLGQAYLAADYPAEASAEFTALVDRRGEAGGLFFDDVPTWRYVGELEEWKTAADRELSGLAAASKRASESLLP